MFYQLAGKENRKMFLENPHVSELKKLLTLTLYLMYDKISTCFGCWVRISSHFLTCLCNSPATKAPGFRNERRSDEALAVSEETIWTEGTKVTTPWGFTLSIMQTNRNTMENSFFRVERNCLNSFGILLKRKGAYYEGDKKSKAKQPRNTPSRDRAMKG